MFWHNFKYSLLTLRRNKMLLFWTFIFPIVLGTFFKMAFSNIENSEKLEVFDIAILENDYFNQEKIFKETFDNLSDDSNEQKLFNVTYTNEDNAKNLLEEEKIVGYLNILEDDAQITVNKSGINETVLRLVVDEILSKKEMVETLAKDITEKELSSGNYNIDYEKIYKEVAILVQDDSVNIKDVSNQNLSYTMIEYYTLIAMSALYGGIIAMFITNYKLANMNSVGKRTAVSSIKKSSLLISSLLASFVIQLIGLSILFIYTLFVLKVDYGSNILLVILLGIMGTLAGLTLGVSVATLVKSNENAKTGILIAVTMLCCFFSGMMGITMKYVVDKNIPILNIINPANMITDGFYALYYYDSLNRYWFNIASLFVFSVILIVISYFSLRRQKYDSI